MAKFYAKSVGVGIDIDTGMTPAILQSASSVAINMLRPNGSITLLQANVVQGTSKIRHISEPVDAFTPGLHKLQPLITFTTGTIEGDTVNFPVFDDFQ